jgi:dihydropteroate synthase
VLDFSRVHLMGILNVTPDSFSDGGRFADVSRAVEHALALAEGGADVIDVGGESTRPGAEAVEVQREIDRVLPVIEALRRHTHVPISIDTWKAGVAEVAIRAGADMINDISGLHFDEGMAHLAASNSTPLVCMHIRGEPRTMQAAPHYDDLLGEVAAWLNQSIAMAQRAGLPRERVIVDPGIGFGKTLEHNLELIRRTAELERLTGRPVLLGPSRKSFIGRILGEPDAARRLFGTAAAVALAVTCGARLLRVHDLPEMAQVVRVAEAIGGPWPS